MWCTRTNEYSFIFLTSINVTYWKRSSFASMWTPNLSMSSLPSFFQRRGAKAVLKYAKHIEKRSLCHVCISINPFRQHHSQIGRTWENQSNSKKNQQKIKPENQKICYTENEREKKGNYIHIKKKYFRIWFGSHWQLSLIGWQALNGRRPNYLKNAYKVNA